VVAHKLDTYRLEGAASSHNDRMAHAAEELAGGHTHAEGNQGEVHQPQDNSPDATHNDASAAVEAVVLSFAHNHNHALEEDQQGNHDSLLAAIQVS
jgi:hypothetical protein